MKLKPSLCLNNKQQTTNNETTGTIIAIIGVMRNEGGTIRAIMEVKRNKGKVRKRVEQRKAKLV